MAETTNLVSGQPPPLPAEGDVWQLVMADMEARRALGIARYGTPLQSFNGRRPLVDAYQELLDQLAYMRQEIAESDALLAEVVRLRAENERLRTTLKALASRHEWSQWGGPCVCDSHREARKLLAERPADGGTP